MHVIVLNRIMDRHPDLTREDVLTAFHSIYIDAPRAGTDNVWIAVGTDERLREIEMIYLIDYTNNRIIIFHAFSPPTKKFKQEIQRMRRRLS